MPIMQKHQGNIAEQLTKVWEYVWVVQYEPTMCALLLCEGHLAEYT